MGGGGNAKDDQIRAAEHLDGSHQWEITVLYEPEKCLNCFKVVPEKYQLSWIKRWYSAGDGKLWPVSKYSMASILVQPQESKMIFTSLIFFLKL